MEPQRVAPRGKRNSASNNSPHASGTNGHPTNVRKGSVKINAPKNNTTLPQKEEVISQEFQKNTEQVQVTKKNETVQKETWAELEDSEEHEKQESQENDQSEDQDNEQSEYRTKEEKKRKRLEAKKNKKLQQRGEIQKSSGFLEPKLNLFLKVAGLNSYRQLFAEKNLRLEDLPTWTDETMTSMGISKTDRERFKEAIGTIITRVPTSGVLDWGKKEVGEWLESVGMSEAIQGVFSENDIDGLELCRLSAEEIKSDLGITSLGMRKKLLEKINALKFPERFFVETEKEQQYQKEFFVENVRPNFSLVLKIDSPEILEKVSEVQNRIRGEFPRLPVQLFPLAPTQGLTMFTMPLHNDERLALAQKTLETLKKEIIPKHFPSGLPKVSFRGVTNFNNRIVWAETLDDEDKERLAAFMADTFEHFKKQDLTLEVMKTPHLTLLRSKVYISGARKLHEIANELHDFDFGTQEFISVDLVGKDEGTEEDGTYPLFGRCFFASDQIDESNKKTRSQWPPVKKKHSQKSWVPKTTEEGEEGEEKQEEK